jgi:hypothetical protein
MDVIRPDTTPGADRNCQRPGHATAQQLDGVALRRDEVGDAPGTIVLGFAASTLVSTGYAAGGPTYNDARLTKTGSLRPTARRTTRPGTSRSPTARRRDQGGEAAAAAVRALELGQPSSIRRPPGDAVVGPPRPDNFRHAMASVMLKQRAPLSHIQDLLGHRQCQRHEDRCRRPTNSRLCVRASISTTRVQHSR